jgi:mRNA-degrading endonuclease RelE of RelBE toxin-antitoxin system
MSYKVELFPQFIKESKRLAKKYISLKSELKLLFKELEERPDLGIPLGNNVYKIRLAIASKGKGKRGGARIITYSKIDDETVLLLSIYNKGEKNTISDEEIQKLLVKL